MEKRLQHRAVPPSARSERPRVGSALGEFVHAITHNRAAVLIAGAVAALVAAGAVWAIARILPQWAERLPVEQVVFVGTLAEVDRSDLEAIANGLRTRQTSMLRLDLAELRAVMLKLEWVRDAQVRRRFPSTIEVAIEEHKPAAIWGELAQPRESGASGPARAMVNSFGEVFYASIDAAREAVLPRLSGPAESSAEVLEKFVSLNAQLVPIERRVRALALSERRAWTATLDNATVLALGRQDIDVRLARYLRAWSSVAALQGDALTVDLRYPTGFAIKGIAPVAAAKSAAPSNPSTRGRKAPPPRATPKRA